MRKLAALVLGLSLAALAGSAAAQATSAAPAPDKSFRGSFNVIARGMQAGTFNLNYAQAGAAYEITAQRRLTGFARTLMGQNQDYDYSARGRVGAAGALLPQTYTHQGGRRRDDRPNGRVVRVTFTPDDIVTVATPHMGMGNPPATQAQKRGAVDQLTAIASLITASGDPCARTVRVYLDGRSRFDFVLTPNGRVHVNMGGYNGDALRCSVQFRPIAGFSDPQQASTLTFLFAPTQSGMYAPIQIEMPTDDVGVVRLQARSLTLNGQRLSS